MALKMQIGDELKFNILSRSHAQANARLIFLGMLHAGVGETHVNNLLAEINVPFVLHKTLKRREREAGKELESLARKTMEDALREEIEKRFAYKLLNSSLRLRCFVFL